MKSNARERDRVIALAALVQSVTLVLNVAETGQLNQADFDTLLHSLVATDASSTEAVYGNLNQLQTGFTVIQNQFTKNKKNRKDKNVRLLRHVISILHLERQLSKNPEMIDLITREIEQVPQQIDYFGSINNPQIIARFADIYHRTISELRPRIQVHGDQAIFEQADNINRVRALLLAGIRAAMLWRQKGGHRWQFILQSNKILTLAEKLANTDNH
ncbi:MAG: lysogenization regulator HflD [Gammaproteobacteria bacterium]|nr:MAG: lysogenization regulator HflD [Gammaproteobacteria bacterium]